jgi:type II secretory ATPase GspE/PulE/Tfp pilus assembly ATPase PilB-like protein
VANNLFKLIKNSAGVPSEKDSSPDMHVLIRCSTEEARLCLPFQLAEKFNVLPLAVIEMPTRKLLTAAAPSTDRDLQKSLEFSCGLNVKLIPLNAKILKKAVFLAYHGNDFALTDNIKKISKVSVPDTSKISVSGLSAVKCEVNDFIKTLLSYAIVKKASDIHLLPQLDGLYVKLRIDGELRAHDASVCSLDIYKRIISRLKTLSNLDTTQSETTHDGSLTYDLDDSSISIRISIMPTIHGEKAVLRLHGIRDLLKLESLGLDTKTYEFLEQSIEKMQGIILCTGSTGSGKSTTLYAILERISHLNKSIITVEDPVEIKLPFASQTSINPKKHIGYPEALKAALRQDPDCIMIGELRDIASTKIAFEAALTGHLVITSLHAGNVTEAVQRLYESGIDKLTLSQTCNLIINQRLIPKLCDSCKVFDLLASKESHYKKYKAVGCAVCDYSGYLNRVIACESLMTDEKIKEAILNSRLSALLKGTVPPEHYADVSEAINALLENGVVN